MPRLWMWARCASVAMKLCAVHNGHIEDVDGDGDDDMVLHFRAREVGFEAGDTSAEVTGSTTGGAQFAGGDDIRLVGGRRAGKAAAKSATWAQIKSQLR